MALEEERGMAEHVDLERLLALGAEPARAQGLTDDERVQVGDQLDALRKERTASPALRPAPQEVVGPSS
jgi:hypothetical protein